MLIGGFSLLGFLAFQIGEFFAQRIEAKTVKLSFSSFISLYEANPNKWKLFYNTAQYDTFFVVFPFISFYKYKIWFNQKEKRDTNKQKLKNLEEFTKTYRSDLKKKQEEEEREMEARIREQLNRQTSFDKPVENDTRERVIVKYTGKLPE